MGFVVYIVLCGPLSCQSLTTEVSGALECQAVLEDAHTVLQSALDAGGGGPVTFEGWCLPVEDSAPADPTGPAGRTAPAQPQIEGVPL